MALRHGGLDGLAIRPAAFQGEQMRTGLDHLPKAKQRELAQVVRILFEEFATAHARGNADWNRKGRILKIILYGSYGAP